MRKPVANSELGPTRAANPVIVRPRFPLWLMAGLLALVTIALYWPATGYDFVNYDDPDYVTTNPHVQGGLTWAGLAWAFGRVHGEGTYWHPLSWVSHMVDCQLYGLRPWGHHLTNVLFHAANAVLVFLVFRRMTGAFWRCLMLAALFAVHPLQVDSVAWVTERKNLLSAFFWLLTAWAYVRYAQRSVISNQWSVINQQSSGMPAPQDQPRPTDHRLLITDHRLLFYLLSLCFFALGLMCKPVLVTLPFVLLLLDYWPLRRFTPSAPSDQVSTIGRLVREKIPFFVLTVASSLITILAHHALGMLDSVSRLPLDMRIANALVSYSRYLGRTIWPSNLAIFYPYPAAWPMWKVVVCGLLLLAISGLVLGTARSRPWLLVGWFWFLGVLVPFSGLVQAGAQAMADRFMYIPTIGIIVALIWGMCEQAKAGGYQPSGLSVAGGAALILCIALTRRQIGYWKESETLFRHALVVTKDNWLAHNNLGAALAKKGQIDEAIRQYQEVIRLKPDYVEAYNNLGYVLGEKGQIDEAIRQFQETLRLKPDHADAHNNLGAGLVGKGRIDEAIRQLQEAIQLKPDNADAHNNLGLALARQGQTDAAIRQFQEALRLNPDYAQAHYNLGIILSVKGQVDGAISQFQEAIRLRPAYPEALSSLAGAFDGQGKYAEAIGSYRASLKALPDQAGVLNNLAWLVATCPDAAFRNGPEAVRLATRACELTSYRQPLLIGTLAAAQAEAGDFQAAAASAERAAALADTLHLERIAAKNRELIQLYRQGQPFHEKRITTEGQR
jgi:protein O-mannosyl-transferase